jgi:hypothetical protein
MDFINDIGLFKKEVDWYWIFLDFLLDIGHLWFSLNIGID